MIAAGKNEIREWFQEGTAKGYEYMLVVYDRMEYPDNSDSPYYAADEESAWNMLFDFRRDSMCEVMEIYDLSRDMEEQLAEKRAWNLPGESEDDDLLEDTDPWDDTVYEPDVFPASGLLSSGETWLQFMERKNLEFIKEEFSEEFGDIGAVASPLRVFSDESREFVYDTCMYVLENPGITRATAAAVYCFDTEGGVTAHGKLLMCADDEKGSGVLVSLPQHHTACMRGWRIIFDICYAQGKDSYSDAYKHCGVMTEYTLSEKYDHLGYDGGSLGYSVDWESHELYEKAMELLERGNRDEAARLLRIASDEGHGEAMYQLGKLLYLGRISDEEKSGEAEDKEAAILLWKTAAYIGHAIADFLLDDAFSQGKAPLSREEAEKQLALAEEIWSALT